jgi:hypothetical protein
MEETPYPPPPGPPPVEPPPASIIPWEDPSRPWTGALFDTVRLLFTQPRAAFERVPVKADVLRPVLFGLALGWIGLVFSSIYELTLNSMMRNLMPGAQQEFEAPRMLFLLAIPFGPLLIAVGILLNSLFTYGGLLLVGGAKNGFVATLRAVCYAQAANLGLVLPFCGGLLAGVGSLVLVVIGISVLQRISIGRAIVAVLIPALACCICIFIGFAAFGTALFGGAMKDMMP